jgi:hypothetical protein
MGQLCGLEAVVLESYRKLRSLSNNLERIPSSACMTLPKGVQRPSSTVVALNGPPISKHADVVGADAGEYNTLRWMGAAPLRAKRLSRSGSRRWTGPALCWARQPELYRKNVILLKVYKIWFIYPPAGARVGLKRNLFADFALACVV